MADWKNPGGSNVEGERALKQRGKLFSGGNIGFGVLDASMNLAAGDDAGTALLKAGATTALWYAAPGVMTAHMVATTAPAAFGAYHGWKRNATSQWNTNFLQGSIGGQYQDTQRAHTMRQAALGAIQGSKLNARSALGGEARILSSNWSRF